ncbi:MOSC domain-containing protein [Patescibacteria group bacterium]|nr:MOSC domain-containing protein [Patescibacteria group bacterium]
MPNGVVEAICIAPEAGLPMRMVERVEAIAGKGLLGDRYASGAGSFNKKVGVGTRQVTLMNACFFEGSGFVYGHSRRNIIVRDTELMWLIGREFLVGAARLRGLEYCDPCMRPSKLAGKSLAFMDVFQDAGGLMAEVLEGGLIHVGDAVVPPPKGY